MRKIMTWTVGATAVLSAACSSGEKSQATGVPDDLQKDLAAASAASVPLASREFEPQKVVSPIESPMGAVPVRAARAPRMVPRPSVADIPEAQRSPDVQAEQVAETAPAPDESAETPAPDVDITPVSTAARPTAQPINMPAAGDVGRGEGGSGMGVGEAIGVIIGTAVIRGGMGGVDHCDPRTDRTRGQPTPGRATRPDFTGSLPLPQRGGIAINNRGGGSRGIGVRRR